MIVVEGPDGAGKTTLIEALLKAIPAYKTVPRVVAKDTTTTMDLRRWVEEDNMSSGANKLYDRHRLISEPIYGPVMRPLTPEPGFDNFNWFYEELAQFYEKRPVLIYCLPPLDMVIANTANDVDNREVAPHIIAIWQGYANKAATDFSQGSRCLIYDYTTDSQPRMLARVQQLITKRRFT